MTADLPVGLLFRTAIASATATLGLVALLFHLRERGRRDLGFYAVLAVGLAAYQVLSMVPDRATSSAAMAALQARAILGMLLPAADPSPAEIRYR